ncbi:MAG TPA: hypothetical protein V6D25_29665 [Leptolyngbyaceae cyanobacterium]
MNRNSIFSEQGGFISREKLRQKIKIQELDQNGLHPQHGYYFEWEEGEQQRVQACAFDAEDEIQRQGGTIKKKVEGFVFEKRYWYDHWE